MNQQISVKSLQYRHCNNFQGSCPYAFIADFEHVHVFCITVKLKSTTLRFNISKFIDFDEIKNFE